MELNVVKGSSMLGSFKISVVCLAAIAAMASSSCTKGSEIRSDDIDATFIKSSSCGATQPTMAPIDEAGNYSLRLIGKPNKNIHEYTLSYEGIGCIFTFQYQILNGEDVSAHSLQPRIVRIQDFSIPPEYVFVNGGRFQRFAVTDKLAKSIIKQMISKCSAETSRKECHEQIRDWLPNNSGLLKFTTTAGRKTLNLIGEDVYFETKKISN